MVFTRRFLGRISIVVIILSLLESPVFEAKAASITRNKENADFLAEVDHGSKLDIVKVSKITKKLKKEAS